MTETLFQEHLQEYRISKQGTFARAAAVTDVESGCLASTFTDYIDGARMYLETESDKDIVPSVREIKSYFSSFVKSLIGSFDRELLNSINSIVSTKYT